MHSQHGPGVVQQQISWAGIPCDFSPPGAAHPLRPAVHHTDMQLALMIEVFQRTCVYICSIECLRVRAKPRRVCLCRPALLKVTSGFISSTDSIILATLPSRPPFRIYLTVSSAAKEHHVPMDTFQCLQDVCRARTSIPQPGSLEHLKTLPHGYVTGIHHVHRDLHCTGSLSAFSMVLLSAPVREIINDLFRAILSRLPVGFCIFTRSTAMS